MILTKLHETWNVSRPANDNHFYIKQKMIEPIGIRSVLNYTQLKERTNEAPQQYLSPGTLMVPAYCNDTKVVVGYETIMPNGRKLMRGRKAGTHLAIGAEQLNKGSKGQTIYMAEGYSTTVSVFMRKKQACFAAFSTSNFLSLGRWLRTNYPDSEIVIAADNDLGVRFRVANTELINPGVYYAKKVAEEIDGKVWIPRAIQNKKTDWNDRHVMAISQTTSVNRRS